jgi:hypothetical protein
LTKAVFTGYNGKDIGKKLGKEEYADGSHSESPCIGERGYGGCCGTWSWS